MKTLYLILLWAFLASNVNAQIFHEDFENPDSVFSSGSPGWYQNDRLSVSGSFCDSATILNPGDVSILTTNSFSTFGYNSVFLYFNQICKIEFFDTGTLQVSPDSGLTWITVCSNAYWGNGLFASQQCRFQEASYATWLPGVNVIADNNWWKREMFDLTQLLSNTTNAQIRFVLEDNNNNGGAGRNGWFIDDILVSDSLNLNLSPFNNRLTGKVFVDMNSNQIQDAGDPPIQGQWIQANNTTGVATTTNSGFYYVDVQTTGPVTITPYPWYYSSTYYTLSPPTHSANFVGFSETDSLNDFAYQPTGTYNDLSLCITSYNQYFNPATLAQHQIFYKNKGTTFQNATIVFYPDSALTYISSPVLSPTSVTPDSIVWDIPNLAPLQYGWLIVNFSVDTSLVIGTGLTANGIIYPITGDFDPSNNTDTINNLTAGSWDPNAITVDKEIIHTPDLVSPPDLIYTIYFQNTGTDTAYNVRVYNVLPPELDMNTYELITTSHNATINFDPATRLIQHTFNNILLPDSNINETASHGFISYRIKPLTTLVDGDSINNIADIYFDFNAPVTTNTAITTIEDPLSINEGQVEWDKLKVFPNPVTDKITVSFESSQKNNISIELFNIYGQKVQTLFSGSTNSGMYQEQFDVSGLIDGFYFIRLENGNDSQLSKFVKLNN